MGNVGKFLEYPDLMGFSIYELRQGSFGQHTQTEGLAFLQSWLFFGLLKEAFGSYSELVYEQWVENYESQAATRKNMISPSLVKYLDIITERLSNRTDRPSWDHWEELFELSITVIEAFDARFSVQYPANPTTISDEPEPLRITWSLLMIGQIITIVAMKCYGVENSEIKQWPDSMLLQRRLQQREWCPYLRFRLTGILSMDGLYFLSLMSWRNYENPYSGLVLDGNEQAESKSSLESGDYTKGLGKHRSCSTTQCLGDQIDEKIYKTSHANPCCPCSCLHDHKKPDSPDCFCGFIGPNVKEVIRILDDKEVPVFFIKQFLDIGGVVHVSVDIGRSSQTEGYVALSHIWADGLGNKTDNRLPVCQVLRIAHILRDFTGKDCPPFWIDTFGVPRDFDERGKALALMNATYRLSEKTLVLDGSLQQYPCYRALDEALGTIDVEIAEQVRMGICVELLLRIMCSSWPSRLWTLPEGMLPPELYFKFFDGFVELGNLFAQLRTWPFIGAHLVEDLKSYFFRLRPLLRSQSRLNVAPEDPAMLSWPSGRPSGRFISMFQALEQRDTSWKEDEALCMAIHLNLNVTQIRSFEPDEEKLQALFAQIEEIPSDLMFTHGARLPRSPYRWAPLHLLRYMNDYCGLPAATPERPMGRRTERGLQMRCRSFQLETKDEYAPNSPMMFFSCFPPSTGGPPGVATPGMPPAQPIKSYGMQLAAHDPRPMKSWRHSNTSALLDRGGEAARSLDLLIGPESFHGPPADNEQGKVCVIVQRESVENGVVFGTPLDTVVVFRMPGSSTVRPEIANSDRFVHLRGTEVPERSFCIG